LGCRAQSWWRTLSGQAPAPSFSNVFKSALFSRCPRCLKGRLYQGFLKLGRSCDACGLDFGKFDSGDGPAVFIILIVGFIVVGAALLVEVAYQPPYWVHAALWIPLVIVLSLALLRPLKSGLIALQFKHDASEGRLIE
jgi:uncharacterized protein (DUF983 family)